MLANKLIRKNLIYTMNRVYRLNSSVAEFKYQELFDIPVPLSYNKFKSLEGIHQRFLNVRFRNEGSIEVLKNVGMIKNAINSETNFKVFKIKIHNKLNIIVLKFYTFK